MKTEIIAVVLGAYFWLAPWALGLMGFGKALTVGGVVFATMLFLDIALDELVRREVERREGTDD